MMQGSLRQYPPTQHRLQKLRQAGQAPCSHTLTSVATLAGMTGIYFILREPLLSWGGRLLARDLQLCTVSRDVRELASMLNAHILSAGLIIAGAGIVAGVLATAVHLLQTGGVLRIPGRGVGRRSQNGASFGLLALLALPFVLVDLAVQWGQAHSWDDFCNTNALWHTWWRWLAILGGLGLAHLLWMRGRFLQQAWMTRQEFDEESRETDGPPLTRQRREIYRLRRQSRG